LLLPFITGVIPNLLTVPALPQYMTEADFNFRMMKSIFTECHLYDEKNNYKVRLYLWVWF
jgi:hypothetical protein